MRDWVSSAIIYQANLRSLAAREPRNPFEAAREKPPALTPLAYVTRNLTAIRELGANVLYLMPPYPIGIEQRKGIGSPYAIRDFRAVDAEYGTLDDLLGLIRRAHALRLKVILDITPNHTSRDHVWTREHPEYYVRNEHGGLFFDWDWSDTAKLDYRQAALRRAMVEVYDFWLGCLGRDAQGRRDGVDGFRLDMAHFINDRGFWNEATRELCARHPQRQLLFLAECYGTANNLELFSRGINAAYDDDFYKVCQYLYGMDATGRSVILPSDDATGNADFRDKLAAFREGGLAGAMARAISNYEEACPPGAPGPWLARYSDNHDEGRGVSRFGDGAVRAIMQLVFTAPRTIPFILAGQEFGAANRPSIHERLGTCDKGPRTCDSAGATVTRSGIEFEGNLFARGVGARREWLQFYRRLIALRKSTPELTRGTFALLDAGEEAPRGERTVIAFERRLRGRAVRCAINLGPEPRTLRRGQALQGEPLYGRLDSGVIEPFAAVVTRTVPADCR